MAGGVQNIKVCSQQKLCMGLTCNCQANTTIHTIYYWQ